MSDNLMAVLEAVKTMPVEKLVKLTVKTREAKSQASKVWEAQEAEFNAIMDACENQMLKMAQETGVEGFKTPYGTTFTATEVKISIADHEAFHNFVREQNDMGFFQARVSVKHVEEFMKNNELETPPPGLSLFREKRMRVRKA